MVELKGRVSDISKYYKQSRMFVLTSRFEGFAFSDIGSKRHMGCLLLVLIVIVVLMKRLKIMLMVI